MTISVSHIVEALSSLGGSAHWTAITAEVVKMVPDDLPADPGASVRARIQERCRESDAFQGRADLFESVFGVAKRKGVWRLKVDQLAPENPDGVCDGAEVDVSAEEGRAALRIHLRRERSRTLIDAFKQSLASFACETCGDDMAAIYGELGAGYIEAHHKVPVSLIEEGETTRLSDLAALCANCHRMIHRNGLMSVEALAAHMRARRSSFAIAAEPGHRGWRHDPPRESD